MPLTDNIFSLLLKNADRLRETPCFHFKREGAWVSCSWNEMRSKVIKLAKGLVSRGVKPGDRVVIFAATAVEWTFADLAILAAGGITVPLYPSWGEETLSFILADASPQFLFADDEEKREKLLRAKALATSLLSFSDFDLLMREGEHIADDVILLRMDQLARDVPASYIYTSGTTGKPKGVVITHGNIMAEVEAARTVFHFSADQIYLSVLPLAHVLARAIQFFQLAEGCQAAYAESIEKLAANYQEIRPHFVVAVPRMLEKIHERVMMTMTKLPVWKQKLFMWGMKTGECYAESERTKLKVSLRLKLMHRVAAFLVLKPFLRKLGGRLSLIISGGAPLSKSIAKFFHAMGVLVLEGYGLTETFAAVTVNRPHDFHFGTVGKTLPGVRIRWADDGEILVKGPMVFREYLHQPEETSAAFDADGWFRTGDIGEYSKDGFLRITDRKKNLIVTSGGKKVAPQPIEEMLQKSPFIDQAMLLGDNRKYAVALLTLNRDQMAHTFQSKGEVWDGNLHDSRVHELLENVISEVNTKLARYETIKRFAIVEKGFSVEAEELTPTLKLRRDVIAQKYKEEIDALYE